MVHISKVGPSGKSFQNSAVRLDEHQPSFFQLKFKGEKCQFGLFWVTCLYFDQRRVGQLDGLSLRKVSDVTRRGENGCGSDKNKESSQVDRHLRVWAPRRR